MGVACPEDIMSLRAVQNKRSRVHGLPHALLPSRFRGVRNFGSPKSTMCIAPGWGRSVRGTVGPQGHTGVVQQEHSELVSFYVG